MTWIEYLMVFINAIKGLLAWAFALPYIGGALKVVVVIVVVGAIGYAFYILVIKMILKVLVLFVIVVIGLFVLGLIFAPTQTNEAIATGQSIIQSVYDAYDSVKELLGYAQEAKQTAENVKNSPLGDLLKAVGVGT